MPPGEGLASSVSDGSFVSSLAQSLATIDLFQDNGYCLILSRDGEVGQGSRSP
jgi:hypothetical protein